MEPPVRIKPESLADYLEIMSKSVFQTGISWQVVEKKWPGIKDAFANFNPVAVSNFNSADMEMLADDKRIIRNHRKIAAILDLANHVHGEISGLLLLCCSRVGPSTSEEDWPSALLLGITTHCFTAKSHTVGSKVHVWYSLPHFSAVRPTCVARLD